MSFFGLNIAGSALSAFQEASNVTSGNLANADTPGASRQIVDLTEAVPVSGSAASPTNIAGGSFSEGVTASQIARIHSDSYDALYRGANSSQAYFSAESSVLGATQTAFGEPSNGINTAYSNFQTAVSNLAAAPSDSTQVSFLSAAQNLASTINSSADGLQQQKTQTLQTASADVTQVNGILDQIAALNGEVRSATSAGDNANTYSDQRDYLIDQLSSLVPTQTSIQSDGSTLVTIGGRAAVNDTVVYHLASPVITTNAAGTTSMVVGFANDPNPANPKPIAFGGSGALGGLVNSYNNNLQTYSTQLDNFANALASSVNGITQASYNGNEQPGSSLLTSGVAGVPVNASNIQVGINDPSQIAIGMVSTAAGSLVNPLNSTNVSINTMQQLDGNSTLANPPSSAPAGLTGTLTINVDGASEQFAYSTAAGGNADTIQDFITNFNSGHYGVSASFNTTSQSIVFARDPNNVDAAHKALQGAAQATPAFTLTDSLQTLPASLPNGAPANSLLEALGAGMISGVSQDANNAYGTGSNGGAIALGQVFLQPVGIPSYQLTATTSVIATGSPTTVSLGASGANFPNIAVGDMITVDNGPGGNPENVTVTGVDKTNGTITATFTKAHAAGFSVAPLPQQTLGGYYGSLVTQLGQDTSTADTGVKTQTNLSSTIDAARQSIDGINVNEETQNLIKYQSSYQAAAETVNIIDSLLSTVITTIGANI